MFQASYSSSNVLSEILIEQKEAAFPSKMPVALSATLWKYLSGTAMDRLPMFVDHRHMDQREVGTVSTARASLEAWMQSKEGLKWREERQRLWDCAPNEDA